MRKHPPKYPLRFLRWFCREDFIEEIEGDLVELFETQYEERPRRAKWIFLWRVIQYFRPAFVKALKGFKPINHISMFRHNLLISFRTFKRYKSSFLINLIGLSTGLTCAILTLLWANDELSFDKFHEHDHRLYQVMRNYTEVGNEIYTSENNSGLLAPALAKEIPEVDHIVPVRLLYSDAILSEGEKNIEANGKFVGKDFFNVFTYKLQSGKKNFVLNDKYAIIISEELAIKLFGTTQNLIGKNITLSQNSEKQAHIISGIFEKPNKNSSDPFDFLLSYELFHENSDPPHWHNNSLSIFLTLKEGANVDQVNQKISDFIKTKYIGEFGEKDEGLRYVGSLFLRSYSDRYLYNVYENGVQAGGRIEYVKLFGIIAIFILLIASINFVNLSTARASRRMKEIGIKKTLGASQHTLIFQFLTESVFINFLSLIFAIWLVIILLPQFRIITGKDLDISFSQELIASLFGISLITAIISGSYPALYLTRFSPTIILRGAVRSIKETLSKSEAFIRRGLVIFQFSISIILIVAVLVSYGQTEFIQKKNLGYNKDNIVSISLKGDLKNDLTTYISEVKNIPGVLNASSMRGDFFGKNAGGSGIKWPNQAPGEELEFSGIWIDLGLIETFGIEMIDGRSFSDGFGEESDKVIFNEAAIAAMGLKSPVGKTVNFWGKDKQIIGVVKNFHFESLYEKVKPFFFSYKGSVGDVIVKIKAGKEQETLARIQDLHESFKGGLTFDYHFVDENYQALYASEKRVSVLSKYFSIVAILVSCLGLFGLAAFTAERRTKEIGIRKVLGSNVWGIVTLLSKEFTKMVIIAICISVPISYFIAREWLNEFAYKIDLGWEYFVGAAMLAFGIAWITVGYQTLKSARINPIDCLRDE